MTTAPRALPGRRRFPPPISMGQLAVLLLVLAGMALTGNYLFRRFVDTGNSQRAAVQTGTVARRTIDSTVSATGAVNATRQVKVSFATSGQVQEVLVKQGDQVQEGQSLATLSTSALEIKRDQAQTTVATAQYRLDALLKGATDADIAAARQTVASAQSSLATAQNTLAKLLEGSSADQIAQARTSLERAQAGLTVAQTAYDKLANGVDLTLRPEYTTLQSARSAQQTAATNYQTKTAPPNSLDLSNAQVSVSSAQATLDSARARLNQVLAGADPLDVANARNQVTSAEAALAAAKAKLDEIQNPTSGTTAIQIAALEAAVTAARANLTAASAAETEALLSGASADAVAKAQATVASARSQLLNAQSSLAQATAGQSPTSAETLAAQQTVATAQTTLLNAQNNLQKLLAGPTAADIAAAQQGVTAADGQLQTAQNALNKLLQGATPEDVAAAKAALDSAQAALDTAQTNWDRLTSGADLQTRSEYTALMSARADYQTALTAYNTAVQGPKEGDVAAAQASVSASTSLVASAQAKLEQVLAGSADTEIGQAQEAVKTAQLALKQAQNDLDNTTLKAPFAGTVVGVGVSPGDQMGASGGSGSTTAPFTLLDPNLVRIDATVDESNVVKLKQGMPVTVTFDSLPGRAFQGTVATVTPAGTTQQGVVTFPVTVVFNGQGFAIPPGTTASLRVITERKENVLAVPSRAISRQGRQTFVTVTVDGKTEQKAVQTGITGDSFTEIVSGLEEGETIITSQAGGTGQQSNGAFGTGGLGTSGGPGPGGGPVIIPGPRVGGGG